LHTLLKGDPPGEEGEPLGAMWYLRGDRDCGDWLPYTLVLLGDDEDCEDENWSWGTTWASFSSSCWRYRFRDRESII